MITEPQPLSITAKGGKKIERRTLQIFMLGMLFYGIMILEQKTNRPKNTKLSHLLRIKNNNLKLFKSPDFNRKIRIYRP